MEADLAGTERTDVIVRTLDDAFAPLMDADADAFRHKFRTTPQTHMPSTVARPASSIPT